VKAADHAFVPCSSLMLWKDPSDDPVRNGDDAQATAICQMPIDEKKTEFL
jgi:hypothetical protein